MKGSNIPVLRQALDAGLKLELRQLGKLIEGANPSYANPLPVFKTSFVDESMRVSRDQDGKLFVYAKVSGATAPTDYSDAAGDLGIGSLFESVGKLVGL